MNNTRIKIFL